MRNISTRVTGAQSETAAANYLESLGYIIKQRNFYTRYGEIDIIAQEGGEIVFVEVKSLVSHPEVSPYELLQPRKLQRLQHTINYWLSQHDLLNHPWRFEFVAVILDAEYVVRSIEHIPQPIF